jgi:hypothetical protein
MKTDNQPRRECRAADLRMWPLLYWTTDPTRLPSECRHLAGSPVGKYDTETCLYGTVTILPHSGGQGYDPAAFDVEDR